MKPKIIGTPYIIYNWFYEQQFSSSITQ